MGVIYLAHDPDIGRKVAIKLVRTDLLDGVDQESYLTRFRQEAQAAGRCMHPNVVSIYDFALHDGDPYLAMEFVDGAPLGERLKQVGRLAPVQAVGLIVQVLAGLGAAHDLGIVHRDVKPANILISPGGHVKMTDFGISRINTSELTGNGVVIGTPAYMSPEQCRGDPVDRRSDLFSTGTVLYELLSGKRPFPGKSASEVTIRLLRDDPPDLSREIPDLPDSLIAALRKAMHKQREARFTSAHEMAEALRASIASLPAAGMGLFGQNINADETIFARPEGLAQGGDQGSPALPPIPAPDPGANPINDVVLQTIERRLARHLGPIARRLVRGAASRNSSVDDLCMELAGSIDAPAERKRFLSDMRGDPAVQTSMTSSGPASRTDNPPSTGASGGTLNLPAELIERTERELTKHIGPIARLLVKRSQKGINPGADAAGELWIRLAANIQNPADREDFLRQVRGGS